MSRIYAKKRQFQAQIRRQHIHQRIAQIRKCIDIELITPRDLAQQMHISIPEGQTCQMIDLLLQRRQSLVILPFGEDMIEEKEHSLLMPLEIHIRFWKLYTEQLDQKQCTFDYRLGQVLQQILKRYSYSHLHQSTAYELHFLNMLQLTGPHLPIQFKEDILEWISGAEGLRVIDVFMEDPKLEFPKHRMFPKMYKVIQMGLRSELKSQNEDAACTLQKVLLKADLDDTFDVYSNCYGLMSYLCTKIERYWKEQATTKFNKAALYLLDTYDQAILDYGRGGLAYTASLLMSSPIEQNYTDGLEMMKMMTQIDENEMVLYLLNDKDIHRTELWKKLCRQDFFVRHPNPRVRQNYQTIIHDLLAIGHQQDIEKMCLQFGQRYEDILQMLTEELDNNQTDENIVLIILESFMSLVYYGSEGRRQHVLLEVFESRGIIDRLEMYAPRQDGVGSRAKMVLDKLHEKDMEKQPL